MNNEKNSKEVLTKEKIRDRLLKREKSGFIVLTVELLAMLILTFILTLFSPILGIGIMMIMVVALAAIVWQLIVAIIDYVNLKNMRFSIVTDRVLIKDMFQVPYLKRPGRYDSRKVLGFYEYGWVKVPANTYNYAEIDDEFFLVVLNNKKTAMIGYNSKFFEYKE